MSDQTLHTFSTRTVTPFDVAVAALNHTLELAGSSQRGVFELATDGVGIRSFSLTRVLPGEAQGIHLGLVLTIVSLTRYVDSLLAEGQYHYSLSAEYKLKVGPGDWYRAPVLTMHLREVVPSDLPDAPALPPGWLLTHAAFGGSGNGDEHFPPTLFRWETRTIGHLWWKRTRSGWRFHARFMFSPDSVAVDYAWRTHRAEAGQ